MNRVARARARACSRAAMSRLTEIEGLDVLGPPLSRRSGVVCFILDGIHPHDLATILDQDGVCVRAGHHCAQPLMRRLEVPATTRASFYVYNDASDVERLAEGIARAQALFAVPRAQRR